MPQGATHGDLQIRRSGKTAANDAAGPPCADRWPDRQADGCTRCGQAPRWRERRDRRRRSAARQAGGLIPGRVIPYWRTHFRTFASETPSRRAASDWFQSAASRAARTISRSRCARWSGRVSPGTRLAPAGLPECSPRTLPTISGAPRCWWRHPVLRPFRTRIVLCLRPHREYISACRTYPGGVALRLALQSLVRTTSSPAHGRRECRRRLGMREWSGSAETSVWARLRRAGQSSATRSDRPPLADLRSADPCRPCSVRWVTE